MALTALFVVSCNSADPDAFVINGTIDGSDNEYVKFSYNADDSVSVEDSVLVENGRFSISGKVNKPEFILIYMGSLNDRTNDKYLRFLIDRCDMSVNIDKENFSKAKLAGSPLNTALDSLNTLYREKRSEDIFVNYIKSNPESVVSAIILMNIAVGMDYQQLKDLYNPLSDNVKAYPDGVALKEELDKLERVLPGKEAPDFSAVDINGKEFSLSSLKGKYVILDFWASWCVPCRHNNPHLKELYKKYNKSGLEVVCVADDDQSPEDWRNAVEKDGIGMFHHVLRGLKMQYEPEFIMDKTNDISEKYAVHFLPTKYLIDKDGRIIGKFDDSGLDEQLSKIFE